MTLSTGRIPPLQIFSQHSLTAQVGPEVSEPQEYPVVNASPSLGTLDPRLQQEERMRKKIEEQRANPPIERQPLSLMMGDKILHDAVESSPFVRRLRTNEASKDEYMQYLINLRYGLVALEPALAAHASMPWMAGLHFEPLFRLKALNQDIQKLGVPACEPSPLVVQYDHNRYFNGLRVRAPYLLVAHAAMRYLAILFGGQLRAQRLCKMWGEDTPIHLYQFSDPDTLRDTFLRELDLFGSRLTPVQYRVFLAEMQTAWAFAGDILDNDIRPLFNRSKL